ncbi:CRISPR-associated protein Cmr1 [Myxococcus sp. AS-1-15]|nr:CRISPR-associated protein Cmr1 [Myxococcus sp. AS-1-15]
MAARSPSARRAPFPVGEVAPCLHPHHRPAPAGRGGAAVCPDSLNLPVPSKAPRPRRGLPTGPRRETFTVDLKTVTPILGGAPVPRQLSEVDPIRVPTLRGHLRFWWRALYGHSYGEHQRLELARRERALWGGMTLGEEKPCRSQVDLCVRAVRDARRDGSPIDMTPSSAYALWPARAEDDEEPVPRWSPGLSFTLEVSAPEGEGIREVRGALRAWVLFGGYGSRTRRGCGTVTFVSADEREAWLPKSATLDDLRRVFGDVPLFRPDLAPSPGEMPLLRGARLYRGFKNSSGSLGVSAWGEALGWLREFRQGISGVEGERARNPPLPGDHPKRPRRSNWPEADKIRHHARPLKSGKGYRAYPEEHAPRPQHSRGPAWPRAGFGLPIVVHFQQKRRDKGHYSPSEPEDVQLQWGVAEKRNRGGTEFVPRDRLASPLIVKAMPLANGHFEPIALWLERAYPRNGEVVLMQSGKALDATRAGFDVLRANDDQPLFTPLREATSLREAFFNWLRDTKKAREA